MKVGDLVLHSNVSFGTGIITGFDEDSDPIVFFLSDPENLAYYKHQVEVISESR